MIEEVRDLLKRIDKIVEAETLRLNDEIDSLKETLRKMHENEEDYEQLKEEAKKVARHAREVEIKNENLRAEINKLKPLEQYTEKLEEIVQQLKQQKEGLDFTVLAISSWIPSQKENIDVLVALASSLNHSCTFSYLQKKTNIPLVTLKKRIIPLLEEKNLVEQQNNAVKLTFSLPEIEEN